MDTARWLLAPPPGPEVEQLARAMDISPILAAVLSARLPAPTFENARRFLQPTLADFHPPRLLDGMDKAASRLMRAIRERQPVVIHGDYDADGVTACALLLRVFRALGHSATHCLPRRLEQGYGFSDEFVEKTIRDGVKAVVTVDCGMSEHERIRRLQAAGVDVIVTDHHEIAAEGLPEACAILNPKVPGSAYPFRDLTGVGVAFKLAWALCEEASGSPKVGPRLRETLLSLLPLVALGTVADVAPLVDENRVAVLHGLRTMNRSSPGLSALLEVCRLGEADLTARDIAFSVSPRLNAAGRMGEADLALALLVEDDPQAARGLALELDRQNSLRQALCQTLLEQAEAEVRRRDNFADAASIAVWGEGWHEGVIGIVAGRLTEMFGKPAAVVAFTPGDPKGKGSARAASGINLFAALAESRRRFLAFGGHEQAAGFSIRREEMAAFRAEFDDACRRQIAERKLSPTLSIDLAVGLADVRPELASELDRLRPYGQGNPAPRLLARNVRVAGTPRTMGAQRKHFWFNASQDGVAHRATVFNNTVRMAEIEAGQFLWDIVFTPSLNRFYDPPRLELRVEDMRPAESPPAGTSGRWRTGASGRFRPNT